MADSEANLPRLLFAGRRNNNNPKVLGGVQHDRRKFQQSVLLEAGYWPLRPVVTRRDAIQSRARRTKQCSDYDGLDYRKHSHSIPYRAERLLQRCWRDRGRD